MRTYMILNLFEKLFPQKRNRNKTLLVAQYMLDKAKTSSRPSLTPMKLMKLVYIAHGYMLGKHGTPLIDENIMAWQYGPAIKYLYRHIRGYCSNPIDRIIPSDTSKFTAVEIEIMNEVMDMYNPHTAVQLSAAMHSYGTPWHETWYREEKNAPIFNDTIEHFYKTILEQKTHLSL